MPRAPNRPLRDPCANACTGFAVLAGGMAATTAGTGHGRFFDSENLFG